MRACLCCAASRRSSGLPRALRRASGIGASPSADDCDSLRYDPIFKMAVGHAPESGDPLCSQPTMSRLENAPSKIEIARLMAALVDGFCESYRRAPSSITLDIDDTLRHGACCRRAWRA